VPKRRHVGQQRRLDGLARDEQFDGGPPCGASCLDQILALGDEQAELVAPPALVQLADELELLVVARADQVS
jgi:hypothetical protein